MGNVLQIMTGIASLILLSLIIYIIVVKFFQKWKCTEDGCDKVFGGDYDTKDECDEKCNETIEDGGILSNNQDQDETIDDDEFVEQEDIDEGFSWKYNCFSDAFGYVNCLPDDNGPYDNLGECQANCFNRVPYSYPYYPYYPYYFRRRPRYWSYRRFGRPRRRSGSRRIRREGRRKR